MYKLSDDNTIVELDRISFNEIGMKERENIQQWFISNPKALGEPLLIIQEEFARFDKTKDRFDLLALDKNKNLVIIENKRDDSGKDVVWQALRYASYCATLTTEQIVEIYQDYLNAHGDVDTDSNSTAKEKILEFLELTSSDYQNLVLNEGNNQRIMLVSKEFRPEVTSTALWLIAQGVRIQCIKLSPFKLDENNILINIDRIIPTPEESDYMVMMQAKEDEKKQANVRNKQNGDFLFEYWTYVKEKFNENQNSTQIFKTISPSRINTLVAYGTGITNLRYALVATSSSVRVMLNIDRSSKEENKKIYAELYRNKTIIESTFNTSLEWKEMPEKKASIISYEKEMSPYNRDNWEECALWHVQQMTKLVNALENHLDKNMLGIN